MRRYLSGALVVLALSLLALIGFMSNSAALVSPSAYNYEYCTTPSQYQYCSTSTSTTTTTTPTTTSTSTTTSSTSTTSTSTTTTTTPTTTSTSTSTSSSTSTSTTTSTTTTTTTPTSTKPGKGCGDKNHLHERRFECKVSPHNATAKEGNAGTTAMTFSVVLSDLPLSPVTVSYATASGTATSGVDFVATSGTLTFPAGVMAQTVTVYVKGDKLREKDEAFSVVLSNVSPNAYLGDTQANGTIVNDD